MTDEERNRKYGRQKYFTLQEAAEYLNLDRSTVYRWWKKRKLFPIRVEQRPGQAWVTPIFTRFAIDHLLVRGYRAREGLDYEVVRCSNPDCPHQDRRDA